MPSITARNNPPANVSAGARDRNARQVIGKPHERPPDDADIYRQIYEAVLEHKLLPGKKLGEEALCAIFKVSRARIRTVLQRLAHDRVIELYPNRGAFVASPTVQETRNLFAARRLFEPQLVRLVCDTITAAQLDELGKFVECERQARRDDDRAAIIRLSGEFHVHLAAFTGNPFFINFMRQLTSLTCLSVALYERPGDRGCNCDHHAELVSRIRAHDAKNAAAFMVHHLEMSEACLDLAEETPSDVDLREIFAQRTSAIGR